MDKLIFKSYEDLIGDIKSNLHKVNRYNVDLVVGIPRSGMIPAYLISAFLNVDCCDVDSFIDNRAIQRGITRETKGRLQYPHDACKVLVVDDSIYSGASMKKVLDKIPENLQELIVSCAIYGSGKGSSMVDLVFISLSGKKLFEWGLFHNNISHKTCFDLDGVICSECLPEQNDDGERYLYFIQNAEPLFLPSFPVYAIVTNRLEKYRKQTEDWLAKYNVQYNKLVMLNLSSKAERLKIDCGVDHKGKYYKHAKDAVLFIESSINQSLSIAKTSGKPVYCMDENKFISPEFHSVLKNNSYNFFKSKYYSLKHKVKLFLTN